MGYFKEHKHFIFIRKIAAAMATGVISQGRSKADTQVSEARVQVQTEVTNSMRWCRQARKITPSELKILAIAQNNC